MQPEVSLRGNSVRFVAAHAAVMLGAVFVFGVPLHGQPTLAQSTVNAAADAVPWIRCPTSEDQPHNQPSQQLTPGQARVVVRGNTMSLEARGCTLTQILSLISARTGIRIAISEAIAPLPRSVQMRAQSIDATIRELLRDTDFFVLYAAESDTEQRLAAVWVYPRGGTHDIEPVPAELWASTQEIENQLTELDPELRARAIEQLIARADAAALPHVIDALADENSDVRLRVLDAALAANLDVPLQHLHALALNDLSPEVRLRALQALEEQPDSAWTIEAATNDPDANVRGEALNILRRVNQKPQ